MPLTSKGTPYVVSTDLVANYPTVSSDLADHIDDNLQYNAQDINAQTGSGANAYTFALADASLYKLVTATNAATATYTVPPQSAVTWANGAVLRILNQGAGVVTLAGGSGVTLNGSVLTLNQYQYAEIHRTASNTWTVIGISTPPGLVKITDATFSGSSAVNINNCFTATYDNYLIKVSITSVSVDGSINQFRLRASGTDSAANYRHSTSISTWAGALSFYTAGNPATIYYINENTNVGVNTAAIDVFGPALVQRTAMTHTAIRAATKYEFGGCSHDAATAYDGFSLIPNTGTFTGNLRIYGYRN